jgi:hypothetical protein
MIEAGEEASDFIRHAAFKTYGTGLVLNRPNFQNILERTVQIQRYVLAKVGEQLANSGINADIGKGNAQNARDYNFEFLLRKSVPLCPNVKPSITNTHSVRKTIAGGGGGYDSVLQGDSAVVINPTVASTPATIHPATHKINFECDSKSSLTFRKDAAGELQSQPLYLSIRNTQFANGYRQF